MDIQGKTIWQQAAGDTNRDYADICLRWDVILNGPADRGPWPACRGRLAKDGWSSKKLTDLWRFCEEMQDGDIVILRLGTSMVLAVGVVVGEYEYRSEFGDVDGWDIQHVRRVKWLHDLYQTPKEFGTYTLKQGDTTQKIESAEINDWLSEPIGDYDSLSRSLVDLPSNLVGSDDVKIDVDILDVSDYLFDHGVASDSIARLLDDIGELTRIAKWYIKQETMPSEYETVAYLVLPLFRALGWTPQRMAVEWNRVDVALFRTLPRSDENLTVVVEAKKMGDACLTAVSQAAEYASTREGCRRLIVTDGLRYGVYTKIGESDFTLKAYLNLTRLKNSYPIYCCEGAETALLAMAPEWNYS
jgi:hypothetical protein